ncbi:hypothetical protein [Actinomadura violacea]|uniref:Uncharacterized protein n=1 Tax=Actinomadura violacea TaxID=2819934 RepID=A0ABS3S5M6_9ACTN|nr:hypothetical protein [Actinomadura violacea]MBO2463584.1 hypothetical protein [Actinomadura violacea]
MRCSRREGCQAAGSPAEQERVATLVDPAEKRLGLAVEQRHGPSAALKSATAVLVRRAESLLTPSTVTHVVVVSFTTSPSRMVPFLPHLSTVPASTGNLLMGCYTKD